MSVEFVPVIRERGYYVWAYEGIRAEVAVVLARAVFVHCADLTDIAAELLRAAMSLRDEPGYHRVMCGASHDTLCPVAAWDAAVAELVAKLERA